MRNLVTIQKIAKLYKHPNADTLDIAEIKGWNIIVKQGIHQEGDLVLFYEIDSFLPVDERYEFLRKNCFKSTQNLGDGFRVKTMKLRGVVSSGLILPLSEFGLEDVDVVYPMNEIGEALPIFEGTDFTEFLKVQKYEKPIPSNLQGKVKGNFPSFIPKTDQERVQNLTFRDFFEHKDDTFEVTTKLDGSSMTVYFYEGKIGVCSRNFDLEETEDNLYWKIFNKLNMKNGLEISRNYALQGELCGPGVNCNHAKLKEHDFYLFDIYLIDEKRYMSPEERYLFFTRLQDVGLNIKHVPILELSCGMPTKDEALQMAEHKFNDIEAEGIVFKSNQNQFSFKAISNKYLIKNDE